MLSHVSIPGLGAARLTDELLEAGNKVAGHWRPSLRRLDYDWSLLTDDQSLIELAKAEGDLWDGQDDSGAQEVDESLDLTEWLSRYPRIAHAMSELGEPLTLDGAAVLEIGGTLKDGRYFLNEPISRLDQVEVSRNAQKTAFSRVPPSKRDKIVFHHAFAEVLPFRDETFDIVFSRMTIHHCRREPALSEIARVLKPGGVMILVERYLSTPLYAAMQTYRAVRRADRGTDDPLRAHELRAAAPLFSKMHCHIYGAAEMLAFARGVRINIEKAPIEPAERRQGALERLLCSSAVIAAVK